MEDKKYHIEKRLNEQCPGKPKCPECFYHKGKRVKAQAKNSKITKIRK